MINNIAETYGWENPESITWRETPSAQRETLIENGEVDMIAATYSINAAPVKKVALRRPVLHQLPGAAGPRRTTTITGP